MLIQRWERSQNNKMFAFPSSSPIQLCRIYSNLDMNKRSISYSFFLVVHCVSMSVCGISYIVLCVLCNNNNNRMFWKNLLHIRWIVMCCFRHSAWVFFFFCFFLRIKFFVLLFRFWRQPPYIKMCFFFLRDFICSTNRL